MKPINRDPMIIAHRGASKEAPENTIAAIQRAIDLGVDYIEFDVRLSKEKIPVIIHDEFPERTTNVSWPTHIESLALEEIQSYDAGSWFGKEFAGEKIPTLEDVLLLDRKNSSFMVEIKSGSFPAKEIVHAILQVIERLPSSQVQTLLFGSFDPLILHELKIQAPQLRLIGILETTHMFKNFEDLDIKHLAIWYPLITSLLMEELKGKTVWVFTVDDEPLILSLTALGVKGIITNHPRFVKKLFHL